MKNRILAVIQIALPLVVFFAFFIPRENAVLKTISVLARYNTTRLVFIASLFLFLAFIIKKERISNLAAAIVIFSLFALSLVGLWASAYSENYVIAGLLPRSDAFYTYTGAVNLLEKGYLSTFTARRPIFGGLLALALWLSGGNLQYVLIGLALLSAAACYFLTLEVKRFLSPAAAVAQFMVQFLFARRFIGITMSEILGYILGAVSLALFLSMLRIYEENHTKAWKIFLLGVLMATLAQAARPGAIATLPLLVLFGFWISRQKNQIVWKNVILTLMVIGLGFLLNFFLYKGISKADVSQNNNAGYGIYGLAVGGKGWEQIFTDHPEINTLPQGEREATIMRIILAEITQHPENFIKGLAHQMSVLFSFQPTNSLYSFTASGNSGFTKVLMAIIFLLSGLGLAACLLKRKLPFYLLMLILLGGFALSLIVAPAYQTQYMRVYAASIPLLALLPAVGLDSAVNWIFKRFHFAEKFTSSGDENSTQGLTIFSLCLLPILFLGPLAMKLFADFKEPKPEGCEDGSQEAVFNFFPGTGVTIFENTPDKMTWVPYVSHLDYVRDIHSICCEEDIQYWESLPTGSLYPAVNLIDGNRFYLVAQPGQLPEPGGTMRVCGMMEDIRHDPKGRDFMVNFEIKEYLLTD